MSTRSNSIIFRSQAVPALFLVLLTCCTGNLKNKREVISLAGTWNFSIDTADTGIKDNWCLRDFSETVKLPGSMAENGKGFDVSLKTDWTGDIVDRSWFTEKKYEKYRQPGNIKIPFWLKPVKYYKGVAWYSRDVDISSRMTGKRIVLFLERCHWQSTLFVNGKIAGSGFSLSTPHEYDVTHLLKTGKNRISIRIDNRILIPVGVNSHSISDHTQTDWNGITGEISLRMMPEVFIRDIAVYPDLKSRTAKVIVTTGNANGISGTGNIECRILTGIKTGESVYGQADFKDIDLSREQQVSLSCPFDEKAGLWSEFNPAIYSMEVILKDKGGKIIDRLSTAFGIREFKAHGTRFEINGIPIFLRGTTECCVFPLTGYPPSDTASWMRIFKICREYGLNHMRFHSYCPPEAAFIAADLNGIYLHVECSSWANQGTTIGDGSSVDTFIYGESNRIIKTYGNHPSFCMLAYGNEPDGKNQDRYLGDLIKYWKSIDNRRVYTSGAGWPVIPENDYNLTAEPRIQHWGEGLNSKINRDPPETQFDFNDFVSRYKVPVIGHEIGQWCAYPDFDEINKYTGVLKATNFEIFRETLEENNLGKYAREFLKASGKLQVLCYKADIEAALRTPGYAGFQMLQLHDFPGQGTALVGILNAFFDSKGYMTPEEFRMFCNRIVLLARMKKTVFRNNEAFTAGLEIANFSGSPMGGSEFICQLSDSKGKVIRKEIFSKDSIPLGNCISVGTFYTGLADVKSPEKLTLEISRLGSSYRNSWSIWVYPADTKEIRGDVIITDRIDSQTEKYLDEGKSVLLLLNGKIKPEMGGNIANGYSTIFWNTAWTNNQSPHTMGILCDPANAIFRDFPTDFHSDGEWWDAVTHSQVMRIDSFPADLDPLVMMIDTWFENRRLALAFECRTGKGKLLVTSIDMTSGIDKRPGIRQLRISILNYMNSAGFNPKTELKLSTINELIK